MNVNAPSPLPTGTPAAATSVVDRSKPSNEAEAAAEFESVLVRQFVQAMTKDLFKASEDGASLSGGQSDLQRDVLTDALTDHLVESGALRLSDLLLRQWSRPQNT